MSKTLRCNDKGCSDPVAGNVRMPNMPPLPACQKHLEELQEDLALITVEYLP